MVLEVLVYRQVVEAYYRRVEVVAYRLVGVVAFLPVGEAYRLVADRLSDYVCPQQVYHGF